MKSKLEKLDAKKIEQHIKTYIESRTPISRDASFDYCYNYFMEFAEDDARKLYAPKNLETSCLQLGFFLASWGMMRKGELRKLNGWGLGPVVEAIADADKKIWEIHLHSYHDAEKLKIVFDVRDQIRDAFPFDRTKVSDILVSKTMLGVFGCVPAFDKFFAAGSGLKTFNLASLQELGKFYETNKAEFEKIKEKTLKFGSDSKTKYFYKEAKLADMIFYVQGDGPI